MSNDDTPQIDELASAYLDGELDEQGRAAATADPQMLAAVDSFAHVRALLGEIGPVDVSAKNAAIEAALSEFDARQTKDSVAMPTAAAATAPVISLQSRRHRTYRIISGVAAAAIVGVVAVAALNSTRNSTNDSAASSATAAPALAVADTPVSKSAADTVGAIEAAPSAATAAASSEAGGDASTSTAPVIDSEDALKEFAASRELATTTAAAAPAAPAATSAPAATTAAASSTDQASPAPGAFVSVTCLSSDQLVLGDIVWRGTPAVAVRNTSTGSLQAIAATDCRVLDEVAAP